MEGSWRGVKSVPGTAVQLPFLPTSAHGCNGDPDIDDRMYARVLWGGGFPFPFLRLDNPSRLITGFGQESWVLFDLRRGAHPFRCSRPVDNSGNYALYLDKGGKVIDGTLPTRSFFGRGSRLGQYNKSVFPLYRWTSLKVAN